MRRQLKIEKIIKQAVINGEAMLVEQGCPRIGFTDGELRVMSQVIYDDLVQEGLLDASKRRRKG